MSNYLLLESGDSLLQETGDHVILENVALVGELASLLNMGWPSYVLGPIVEGSFDQAEVQHLLHMYAGILTIPKAQALGLPTAIRFEFAGRSVWIAVDKELGTPQVTRTLERR